MAQAVAKTIAIVEIGGQRQNANKGYAQRHHIHHRRESVVKSVKRGRYGQSQDVEALFIARVQIGEAHEIAAYATPKRVQERKRGETGYVQEEGRGVIGPRVDRDLILHALENAKGYARHQPIVHQRLRKYRFLGSTRERQEGKHFDKLLGDAHAQHIPNDARRERHLGEKIEKIEVVKLGENEEDDELGEKKQPRGGNYPDLSRAKKIVEKHAPYHREIERHGIKHQVAAYGKHEQHRRGQARHGKDEQPRVVAPTPIGHGLPRENEPRAYGSQLLAQRAMGAYLGAKAPRRKKTSHRAALASDGVARLVVHEQLAILHVFGHHILRVRAVLTVVPDNVYHLVCVCHGKNKHYCRGKVAAKRFF